MSIYPPEIVLNIESEVIHAKTRKLRAAWTFEAQQDIRSLHGIAEVEDLADILAEEIANEIDQEILKDLRDAQEGIVTEEFRFKHRKKKIVPRSIEDDWQVSRFD
jgi:ATP-dependent RNA circularization protein (DNA/RNA ligase family)